MARLQASLVLMLIAGALAATRLSAAPPSGPCFNSGSVTYRVGTAAAPGLRVRIDDPATSADLRIQLVDDPSAADFVLIDDQEAAGDACQGAGTIRDISVTSDERVPALNVALSDEAAEHRLFVRSSRFSREQAAALFAAMWDEKRKRDIAEVR